MLLNIALILHIVFVILSVCYSFYQFFKLPAHLQYGVELSLTWFGKAAFISLLILLYRIGG